MKNIRNGKCLVDILIELEHDNLLTTFQLPKGVCS